MATITEGNPTHISLELKNDRYDVLVGSKLIHQTAELIQSHTNIRSRKAALVTDSNVAPLYSETIKTSLKEAGIDVVEIIVPAGEASKSMEQTTDICRQMLRAGLDRKSFLVALGGGVVGDLAGFAAAIFQRGIPCVQIPTTVVSQVDSSVGGKTGVNTPEGKNLIGAFHQPRLVIADVETLSSLPDREFNEGFAEIIKHAAIRDPELLTLTEDRSAIRDHLIRLMTQNVEIKAAIVEEDEKETAGVRALLNFGHTIGHGIESAGRYGRFLHGEAISYGLLAATRLSVELAGLSEAEGERIIDCLKTYDLPITLDREITKEAITSAMARDKKFEHGEIRFVLLDKIGSAFVSDQVTMEHIESAIDDLY